MVAGKRAPSPRTKKKPLPPEVDEKPAEEASEPEAAPTPIAKAPEDMTASELNEKLRHFRGLLDEIDRQRSELTEEKSEILDRVVELGFSRDVFSLARKIAGKDQEIRAEFLVNLGSVLSAFHVVQQADLFKPNTGPSLVDLGSDEDDD